MSDKDPKETYKKPESHQLSGDDLEDVAGGAPKLPGVCDAGQEAPANCAQGQTPRQSGNSCQEGKIPQGPCASGTIAK